MRYADEDLLLSTFSRRPHRLSKWLKDWRNLSNPPSQHHYSTVKKLRPREVQWPAQDHRAESRTQGSQLQTGDVPLCTTLQPWMCHEPASRFEKVSTGIQSRADFHWSYFWGVLPLQKRQSYTNFFPRAEQCLESPDPTTAHTWHVRQGVTKSQTTLKERMKNRGLKVLTLEEINCLLCS